MNLSQSIRISNEEYIKKYWWDFYGQPDAKYPKREYELKIGLPTCRDDIKKMKNK